MSININNSIVKLVIAVIIGVALGAGALSVLQSSGALQVDGSSASSEKKNFVLGGSNGLELPPRQAW